MNNPVWIGLALFLGCTYGWMGWRASRSVKTDEDYFLMGRKLTFWPLCLTLLATQLGGGVLLGAAQEAYEKGWMVLMYPMGASLGLVVLGTGFGARLRRLNISTVAEVFEVAYGSRSQRSLASLLSIVAFFLILVGQGIAARQFFGAIGVSEPLFIVFWLVFVLYTVMGGLQAVVDTDMVQVLLILLGLCVCGFTIDGQVLPPPSQWSLTGGDWSAVSWSSWMLMPFLFMLIEQDMGQRCFAAKTAGVVSPAATVAGLTLLVSATVAVGIGVLGRNLGIEAQENSSILIEVVVRLTPSWASTLFIGSVLMAVASTADSILCSISSNIACDFLNLGEKSSQKEVNASRLITLIIGLAALLVGYAFDQVVGVLMLSYELSVCMLFVPVVVGVLVERPSQRGAWGAMLFGALGLILFRWVDGGWPKEVLTLLLSAGGYLACAKK